jgi:Family of unknown function (DUF6011)
MSVQLALTPIGISREFLFAGRAIFTVSNGRGERYTFRVRKKELLKDPPRGTSQTDADWRERNPPEKWWFVQLLTGPENTNDYTYVGVLLNTGAVKLTTKSKFTTASKPYRVANWVCQKVVRQEPLPSGYEVLHAGRCGRCGRLLTVPESIKTGLGPECAGRV